MKKMQNEVHIEGLLYESSLELKQAGASAKNPGMEYVTGVISIQVAKENIVKVRLYEAALTSKGAPNGKFQTAKDLVSARTVLKDGPENAIGVRIDSNIAANDFLAKDNQTMVSTMENFGGFIHITPAASLKPKAEFKVDVVLNKIKEEQKKDGDAYVPTGNVIVSGVAFDFRGQVLPVEFTVKDADGINFFQNLLSAGMQFTAVWGRIENNTVTYEKVEKSAFGGDKVTTFTNTKRSYVVEGTLIDPYQMDESTLTTQELTAALQNRNVMLDALKQSQIARRQNRGTGTAPATFTTPAAPAATIGKKTQFDF